MKCILPRLKLATLALGAILATASGSASAASLFAISYDDVGLGNLSGYNPLNIIDGQTATLTVQLSETDKGLVTKSLVSETLNGAAFTVTQRGSETGNIPVYVAGFTFNLGVPSYIQYVPNTAGQTWGWIKGVPKLLPPSSTSFINIAVPDLLGSIDATHFALLPAGKYTLLFAGIVDLAAGETTSFGGTLSAVPLPGSLVMFGAALLGLTALGARRRPSL